MALGLKPIRGEGGTGGKRGHSNMMHWAFTHEIKDAARVRRRLDDKLVVGERNGPSMNEHDVAR